MGDGPSLVTMSDLRRFTQVDVFGTGPHRGNALAVVHDAEGLDDERLADFARWTQLSETTFLLPPTSPDADYRVRIFTVGGELPFAGHPTLGSAAAWLGAGGVPRTPGRVVQECGLGLVPVRTGSQLAFAAPPLRRSGPVEQDHADRVLAALGLSRADVLALAWIDNGPGWVGIELPSAEAVLAVRPDPVACRGIAAGVVGRYAVPPASGAEVEVRAFYGEEAEFFEDPVTGSLQAGLAQWLIGAGRLPARYLAAQGQVVGRDGLVHVEQADGEIWIGGTVHTVIEGSVRF